MGATVLTVILLLRLTLHKQTKLSRDWVDLQFPGKAVTLWSIDDPQPLNWPNKARKEISQKLITQMIRQILHLQIWNLLRLPKIKVRLKSEDVDTKWATDSL